MTGLGISDAATLTWDGGGLDNNVLTGANWNTNTIPVTGDVLIFTGSAWLLPTLSVNRSVASLSFNTAASSFTLGGTGIYTLTAAGGIVNAGTNLQTINNALVLGNAQTWSSNLGSITLNGSITNGGNLLKVSHATGTTTLNGILRGIGGLTKAGTGTLVLNGANTYSGTTTLGAGNVVIGSNSAFGTSSILFNSGSLNLSSSLGAASLANGYTISQNLKFSGSNSLTLNSAGTLGGSRSITVTDTGSLTLAGSLTGSSRTLTKAGAGTLILGAANTISKVTLSAGTLFAGSSGSLGSGTFSLGTANFGTTSDLSFSNALTLAGNTSFVGTSGITFNGAAALTATRALTFDGTAPVIFNGVISGSGFGITKSGSGTMTLSGTASNTFNGVTKINDGQLTLAKTAGLNAIAGALEIGNGSGGAASTIVQLNASNQIPDSSAVSIFSDGQLRLQSFSDTIGGLTLYGGSIIGTGSLGLGGNLTFSGTGGAVASIESSLVMTAARTFIINSNGLTGADMTISGGLSGAFSATKTGAGNLLLSGSNTFSGGYLANAGSTYLGSSNAVGTAAANIGDTTGTNDASLLFHTASGMTVANAITVRSGSSGVISLGGLNSSGVNTLSGAITLNKSATFTAEAGGEVVLSGGVSGVGGFTKIGEGIIRLSGSNTSSGALLISAGTLALGGNSALGSGTLTLSGGDLEFGLNRTATTGAVILDDDSSILGSGTSTLTSTGGFDLRSGLVQVSLAGGGNFSKTTIGSLTLTGSNIYTGTTNISAGNLILGKSNALPTNTTLTVGSGAVLSLQGFATQTGSLTGAGSIQLGNAAFTTGGNNTSTTFSGVIGGTGGIVKTGTGNLTLSGSNSYTGVTTINGGVLALGASHVLNPLSSVALNSGSFNLGTFSQTIAGLTGSGSASIGGGTLGVGSGAVSSSFGGIISGSGSLVKSGTGTFTLSGANSTTASLEVNSGIVLLQGAAGTLSNVPSVILHNGGTLQLDNAITENADRIGNSTAIRLDGGTLSLISDNNGTHESVGNLSAIGGASTVNVTHNGGAGTASSLTFSSLGSIASGATVNFTATGGVLGASTTGPQVFITGQATGLLGSWATVGADPAEYFSHGIRAYSDYYEGDLGININSVAKIVRLSGTSAPAASILSNTGTTTDLGLNLTDIVTVDLGTDGSRTLNLQNGSLIKSTAIASTIQGAAKLTAGGTSAGNLNVSVTSGSSLAILSEISNNASGVVGLTKGDLGSLTLGGTNAFTGNVFINDGVLSITSEANLGSGNKDLVFNGGTLRLTTGYTASSTKIIRVTSGITGTLDIADQQTFTLANTPGMLATGESASTLVKAGTGSFVIQNANTGFLGKLRLDQGTTEIRNAASLGTGTIQINGGSLSLVQNTSTAFNNNLFMLADGSIHVSRLSGSGSVIHTLGELNLDGKSLTVTGEGAATAQFNSILLGAGSILNPITADLRVGNVSGSFSLTKSGSSALILTTASSYTGATNINAGTIRLSAANLIPDSSIVSISTGATFDLAGYSETIAGLSGSGNVTLGGGTLSTGAGSYSGVISGTGGLVKTGTASTFTLSGTNSYTGSTTVSAGSLAIGVSNSLSPASALSVANGATFLLNNHATSTASISGGGTISLGSGFLTTGTTSTSFSGNITGSGGLIKTGVGALTLSGASTYSGSTALQGGSIVMRSSNALGSSAGAVTIASGSALALENNISVVAKPLNLAGTGISNGGALVNNSGSNSWAGAFALPSAATINSSTGGSLTLAGSGALGGSALTLTGAGMTTLSGVVSGNSAANSSAIFKTGTGTTTLSGINTFSGITNLSQGTLIIGSNNALGGTGSGHGTIVASGATLQLQHATGLSIGDEFLTLNGTGISGNGALRSFSGTNTWSGDVTLANDTTMRVDAGSILNLNGSIAETGGARILTKDGTGTLTLSGLAITSGSILIQSGTLQLGASERISDITAVNISAGAIFDLNNNDETIGSLIGAGAVNLGSDIEIGGSDLSIGGDNGTASFSGIISGLGSVKKIGNGTQTLSGTNTYTGITTLSGGVISISSLTDGGVNSGIGSSTSSAANLVFDGGTLRYTGAAQSTNRAFTIDTGGGTIDSSGTGALTLSGAATLADIDIARSFTLSGTNTGTNIFAAALADNGNGATSLTKSGSGTWVLNGAHTYTGSTTVADGILRLGSINRLGDLSAVVVSSGATLDFAGFSDAIGSLAGGGNIILGSAAFTTGANSTSTIFSGIISGPGSLTKTGTGNQTLSGTSSYSGITTINGGTLSVASLSNGGVNSSIGASSNLAANLVINGGTLRYIGTAQSTNRAFTIGTSGATIESSGSGALTLSGAATFATNNAARTLTLGGTNTGNNAYTSAIANSGNGATSLVKSGAGTWELTGTNSYTGVTTVNGGKLVIGVGGLGSLANSAVNVQAGATLGGSGVIGGSVTIQNNGTLAAGNSPGVLTAQGGTTFISGSIFEWELDLSKSNAGVVQTNRGSAYDGLNTASVTGSNAVFKILLTGDQNFSDAFWDQNHNWSNIIMNSAGSSVLANWSSVFTNVTFANASGSLAGPTVGSFTLTGNTLSWSAVPEPSSAVVVFLLAAGLFRRSRTH